VTVAEFKGTRGPWTLDPKHPTEWNAALPNGTGVKVGMCFIIAHGIPIVDDSYANARLAAAAPEMLEALKRVVAIADRATVEFDAAKAAIAKAEGRP
jgi:hypothetical protein